MVIKNARVFRQGKFRKENLCIMGQKIADLPGGEVVEAEGLLAIPGLVDIHLHGCAGRELNEGTEEAIQTIADYQLGVGVTAICPATVACAPEQLSAVAKAAAAHRNGQGADLVGLHLEGPFLNADRCGAIDPYWLTMPDADLFLGMQRQSGGLFKIVTLSPELPGAMEFISRVKGQVQSISVGHTEADYDTAAAAFAAGADHLTHCFNAMPGIGGRTPGPALAAMDAGAWVEIIADGVHLHPAVVRSAFKLFGEKLVMVSDSTMAAGLPEGRYTLGGQEIQVSGRRVSLAADPGTLAGSCTHLMDCLRCAVNEMKLPLEQVIPAVTENPAKAIGVDDLYGSLEQGRYGDVLLLDEQLKLVHLIRHGKLVW